MKNHTISKYKNFGSPEQLDTYAIKHYTGTQVQE